MQGEVHPVEVKEAVTVLTPDVAGHKRSLGQLWAAVSGSQRSARKEARAFCSLQQGGSDCISPPLSSAGQDFLHGHTELNEPGERL